MEKNPPPDAVPDPPNAGKRSPSRLTLQHPTRWSVILRTRDPAKRRKALDELFRCYEHSVVKLMLFKGVPPDMTAQDAAQAFFARALARDDFAKLSPEKGSFRSWLKTSIVHFVNDLWRIYKAQRRGNQQTSTYVEEPPDPHDADPGRMFDRQFALDTMDQVIDQLRALSPDPDCLDDARRFLPGRTLNASDVGAFARLTNKSNAAASAYLVRLRKSFQRLLHETVAATLPIDPETSATAIDAAVAAELSYFFELLAE